MFEVDCIQAWVQNSSRTRFTVHLLLNPGSQTNCATFACCLPVPFLSRLTQLPVDSYLKGRLSGPCSWFALLAWRRIHAQGHVFLPPAIPQFPRFLHLLMLFTRSSCIAHGKRSSMRSSATEVLLKLYLSNIHAQGGTIERRWAQLDSDARTAPPPTLPVV